MRRLAFAAALAALVLTPLSAQATIISLTASLDGLQEVPPNASPATGTASITFDDVSNLLSWTIVYSGIASGTNNAHFHGPAAPGVSASPVVSIPFTFGATGGTLVGSATITPTGETQLLAGLWYINIHSVSFPGGEIRGQVLVVPEPVSAALVALGLGGLALAGRRRI